MGYENMQHTQEQLSGTTRAVSLADRASFNATEFCKLHGFGRTKLYDLWKRGDGPEFFRVGNRRRIPADVAREWRGQGSASHD